MNDATQFFGGVAGGYEIERSLRFNSSDSAYLSRTPAVAGDRRTWTWSAWVKRSNLGGSMALFSGSTSTLGIIGFGSDDTLFLNFDYGTNDLVTTQVFRDSSAWYHILCLLDTNNSTATDRLRLYVNNNRITAFSTANYPTLGALGTINIAEAHNIGRRADDGSFLLNGYLADIHFIDGQALDPSSFTETDANGVLQPKAYEGTYGTNGFHLPFSDNSTAAALGTDTSGNGNTWTVNNVSVAAAAGNDSIVDSPTNYGTDTGAGGEVRGNYATWNPLSKASDATLSNGNLDASLAASSYPHLGADSTIQVPASGKWYWEITPTTVGELWLGVRNVVDGKQSTYYRDSTGGFNNIRIEASSSTGAYSVASFTNNDVIGVALNADSLTITWYKNGSQVGSNYSLTTVQNLVPFVGHASSAGSAVCVANFGQRPFAYTAPSGFKALCTTNLPEPTIADGSTAMDVKLYTGNGSTQTISGLNFESDFLWIKRRDGTNSHQLTDSVRGLTKYLFSDATLAEETRTDQVTATSSTGFSLGSNAAVNTSAGSYVAWTWDAGSSTVTNTQGSITSQVRANASAGFSVVTYTSQSSGSATIGHGLGVAPSLIITKPRDQNLGWTVYHASLGNAAYLVLNTTAAQVTGASTVWNSTSPTSAVFTQGGAFGGLGNMVAYCFAPVAGYSSFGSYTGNGSTDGPFVYTGFRPRWVMIKNTSANSNSTYGSWKIIDTSRDSFNGGNPAALYANAAYAEGKRGNGNNDTYTERLDLLSNGFKLGASVSYDIETNESGVTYIYAAFAEHPFATSRAR